MVPFAGYDMPVQFEAGIIAEHLHTREKASVFDVSHMGQAILKGDNTGAALETLVPGDIQGLNEGRARYTLLTNEQGGILDDLMVTNQGDHLYLVVNAACKEGDFNHIQDRIGDVADLEILDDRALIAIQGPAAAVTLPSGCSPLNRRTTPSVQRCFSTLFTMPCARGHGSWWHWRRSSFFPTSHR